MVTKTTSYTPRDNPRKDWNNHN